jgi:REP element-mobilizing transposase RayT
MKYNPEIHKRRSIRLKGYDYSQAGLYFITICVQNRRHLFGNIQNGNIILNDAGKMIDTEWKNLKNRFPNIELHEYVIMPNHFHGILEIVGATTRVAPIFDTVVAQNDNDVVTQNDNVATTRVAPTNKTVGDMMDAFKSITTVEYIRGVKNLGWQPFDGKLWQRNYYEHIIRNEQSYQNISNYIINNPAKWQEDKFY